MLEGRSRPFVLRVGAEATDQLEQGSHGFRCLTCLGNRGGKRRNTLVSINVSNKLRQGFAAWMAWMSKQEQKKRFSSVNVGWAAAVGGGFAL